MPGAATFSPDGFYRYDLIRRWGRGPLALWVMLNPSTADAEKDDPTIRRCIAFSKREGCGGLVVCNLYAMRTTRPVHLTEVPDPVGPENIRTIRSWAQVPGSLFVVAWGAWADRPGAPAHPDAALIAHDHGHAPVCLGMTASGAPRHPLYVKGDTPFVPWEPALVRRNVVR